MADELTGRKVAVLLTHGFEQVEMTSPREALERKGAIAHLVSPAGQRVRGWNHDRWGEEYQVDAPLADTSPEAYDALLLPGGVMNPDQLRQDEQAVAFVRHFVDRGKPIASICHGPWTLIEADAVRGRRMTSYASLRTDLRHAGAEWVDEPVVEDGGLVTSRNPHDLEAFNERMLKLFHDAPLARSAA